MFLPKLKIIASEGYLLMDFCSIKSSKIEIEINLYILRKVYINSKTVSYCIPILTKPKSLIHSYSKKTLTGSLEILQKETYYR